MHPARLYDFKHPLNTREGRIERAVAIFQDANGTINQKVAYLVQKGMQANEITSALNEAGDGALLEAAGI